MLCQETALNHKKKKKGQSLHMTKATCFRFSSKSKNMYRSYVPSQNEAKDDNSLLIID